MTVALEEDVGLPLADRLTVAMLWNDQARLLWVVASDAASELVDRHTLTGRAALLGAELAVANMLMSAWIKGDERVTLQVQAESPKLSFFGETDAQGAFRGQLTPNRIPGVGRTIDGMLLAIKADGEREMYRGVSAIQGETIASALERHLRTSDQVSALVRIDANQGGRVLGLMIERVPGATGAAELTEAEFVQATSRIRAMDAERLATELSMGKIDGQPIDVLDIRTLRFRCRCSDDRVDSMLASVGATELQAMIDEDGGAEIRCHFCAEVRHRDVPALQAILARGIVEA